MKFNLLLHVSNMYLIRFLQSISYSVYMLFSYISWKKYSQGEGCNTKLTIFATHVLQYKIYLNMVKFSVKGSFEKLLNIWLDYWLLSMFSVETDWGLYCLNPFKSLYLPERETINKLVGGRRLVEGDSSVVRIMILTMDSKKAVQTKEGMMDRKYQSLKGFS